MTNHAVILELYDQKGDRLAVDGWKIEAERATTGGSSLGVIATSISNMILCSIEGTTKASSSTAESYIHDGYGGSVTADSQIHVNNHDTRRSAHMSVHGTFGAPKKMNFYFPLTITTPDGLQIKLLLGMISEKPGWLKALRQINHAVKHLAAAVLAAEEDDESGAWEETKSFGGEVIDIIKEFHNPWYVTVIGTEDVTAVIVPEKFTKYKHRYPRLLCIGESDEYWQAACFYYDPYPKQSRQSAEQHAEQHQEKTPDIFDDGTDKESENIFRVRIYNRVSRIPLGK